jgi:hypothetical protein
LLPSFNRAAFRGSHTTNQSTWGSSRSCNQAAQVPSSKVSAKVPCSPWMNSTIVTALVSSRAEDVEYRRGAEDRNKRLMGRLRGKRLAYTSETVSGGLDWTLLKLLTGGDTLAGANLYENTEGFAPSHTLVLTTIDRPKLPPTVAFAERLRLVPFTGDFSKSKDFSLEDDLSREMPGILWQLIKAAPAVFEHGDEPRPPCLSFSANESEIELFRRQIVEITRADPRFWRASHPGLGSVYAPELHRLRTGFGTEPVPPRCYRG